MNDNIGILKILVVDDCRIDATIISCLLRKDGHVVSCIHTGEEAAAIVWYGQDFDVIFMDVDLGDGISGITAAEYIFRISRIPVIFLTSHARESITCILGDNFVFGYISKSSYTSEVLRKAIHMTSGYSSCFSLNDINSR